VLHVRGLSSRTREDDVRDRFAKYGKILSCKLITDPRTRESRGFAFVTFETAEQSEDAMYHMDRTEIDGRQLVVEKAKRGRSRSPTPGKYLGKARPPRDVGPDYRSSNYYGYYGARGYYGGGGGGGGYGGPDRSYRNGGRRSSPYSYSGRRSPYYDRRSPYYDR
jgi:transformer-2 protein